MLFRSQLVLAVITLVIFLAWWIRYLKALNAKLEDSQRKLELLSVTDSLTKVFNRLKMDEVFIQEIETSKRYHSPLSIIMLDIDYFKKINDEHGHIVGDKVLKSIAQLIKSNLRSIDFLGRWGGEEFLIICPSTGLGESMLVAEKLRVFLIENDFAPVERVTASFGVAQWQEGESQESLISRADTALYKSKNGGRNKVTN